MSETSYFFFRFFFALSFSEPICLNWLEFMRSRISTEACLFSKKRISSPIFFVFEIIPKRDISPDTRGNLPFIFSNVLLSRKNEEEQQQKAWLPPTPPFFRFTRHASIQHDILESLYSTQRSHCAANSLSEETTEIRDTIILLFFLFFVSLFHPTQFRVSN